jgi:dTDP-4-dehydrorhamnose 3,5-epimerase-like enzyme
MSDDAAFPISDLWHALSSSARAQRDTRSYAKADLATRLGTSGVEAGEIATDLPGPKEGLEKVWIPGVEIFQRRVWQQRHRGWFGEFTRLTEGRLKDIGLNPQQWASATMFSGTAKGFHIHPPSIPDGISSEEFFQKNYVENPTDYSARPYGEEQWDAMFFVQGVIEFLLVDERAGMTRRVMRFIIDGDNIPGPNNIGLIIPAGVAHALRCGSSQDVIMVYGTSTTFTPEYEGRIASGVEQCPLPEEWQTYLDGDSSSDL